jgi:hypothetical protein
MIFRQYSLLRSQVLMLLVDYELGEEEKAEKVHVCVSEKVHELGHFLTSPSQNDNLIQRKQFACVGHCEQLSFG